MPFYRCANTYIAKAWIRKSRYTRWEGGEMGQGWEVCEIKCRACETKFIPLARRNAREEEEEERRPRALGEVSGRRENEERREGKGRSERWQKRHKSDGHPKVPRNTKQKKDRARAGVATLERGSQSGRLFSNNLPPGWRATGMGRRRGGRRGRSERRGRGIVGWRFSGSSVGGDGGCTRGRLGAYCC